MAYDLYPAVDPAYNFPPEIRRALAISMELRNTVVPMTTTVRNNLLAAEKWDGRVIANTTIDRLERYDAGTAQWNQLVEFSDVSLSTTNIRQFANEAARNAAIPAPINGQSCYLLNWQQGQTYEGGTWWPTWGVVPWRTISFIWGTKTVPATWVELNANTPSSTTAGGAAWAGINGMTTIPLAGRWRIDARFTWAAGPTGSIYHQMFVNHASTQTKSPLSNAYVHTGAPVVQVFGGSLVNVFAAGDIINMAVFPSVAWNLLESLYTITWVGKV